MGWTETVDLASSMFFSIRESNISFYAPFACEWDINQMHLITQITLEHVKIYMFVQKYDLIWQNIHECQLEKLENEMKTFLT